MKIVLMRYALRRIIFALMMTMLSAVSASADGPSAWLNVNYSDLKQYEEGKKTQATDTLFQNYYFRFEKSVTPLISYQLYLRTTLNNTHTTDYTTDPAGKTEKTYLRAAEPSFDFFLHDPVYKLDAGLRRLEQWTTANLTNEGRRTTEFYYSRLNLTPYSLPALSLEADLQKDYDHLDVRKLDTADTRYTGSSWYDLLYKGAKLSYNLTYTRDEIKTPVSSTTKNINDNLNALYNLGYARSFRNNDVNISAGYQGNYARNKNQLFGAPGSEVPVQRIPEQGLYGIGTISNDYHADNLTSVPAIIDRNFMTPVTTGSGTINLGANGTLYQNMGLKLQSNADSVDRLYIYVNKDISNLTVDKQSLIDAAKWKVFLYNQPVQPVSHTDWNEVTIKIISFVPDTVNNKFYLEIIFATPQKGFYFKAINLGIASLTNDILITEIEAYGAVVIGQSGKTTTTTTFFSHGINLNANLKPLSKVTVSLNYFLNRADQNPDSVFSSIGGAFENIFKDPSIERDKKERINLTRTYGVNTTWFTHKLLTTTVRYQRNEALDNKEESNIKSDTYSLTFNSAPLPTLDATLSIIRTYNYSFDEKQSLNNLYLLTIGSKLHRYVNMITDIGYTESETYKLEHQPSTVTISGQNTTTDTKYMRGILDARLTDKLSANLSYGFSQVTGTASSDTTEGALVVTYRPGRFISFTGNFRISDFDDNTNATEGIFVDWLVVPAVRLNINYQHTTTEPGPNTLHTASSYIIWYVTKFLDFQITANYIRDKEETTKETYSLGGNVNCRFW